jgi:triacylglycerol esterase/lipase EstA (alpha/beta hydrolase family)
MCRNDAQGLPENDKIVLVGHSFGGIIIKSLFVTAFNDRTRGCHDCERFFNSTKGLIFYGVPHSGRTIERYVQNFNIAFQNRLAGTSRELTTFQNTMNTLSRDFEVAIRDRGITIYSFGEQLEYNKVSFLSYF